jgi:hypothetical protein
MEKNLEKNLEKNNIPEKKLDNISIVIILRSLYLFLLLDKGWVIRKGVEKNTFRITKVKIH